MNMQVMNDHIANKLERETPSSSDVDVVSPSVEGLVAVHDELLLELDVHVSAEDDPERLRSDDGVAESARLGVDHVGVAVVGDDVDVAVAAADGVFAEAERAVGEGLAVLVPLFVAAPAVVHGVAAAAAAQSSAGGILGASTNSKHICFMSDQRLQTTINAQICVRSSENY